MFAVLKYAVSVFTGKRRGAGTDANVFMEIFGEQGDTGERPLQESKTNMNKFERGKASVTLFSCLLDKPLCRVMMVTV